MAVNDKLHEMVLQVVIEHFAHKQQNRQIFSSVPGTSVEQMFLKKCFLN